eukprot:233234_1
MSYRFESMVPRLRRWSKTRLVCGLHTRIRAFRRLFYPFRRFRYEFASGAIAFGVVYFGGRSYYNGPVLCYTIEGPSMFPTLQENKGQVMLRTPFSKRKGDVGDIIVFRSPNSGKDAVKRIIATEGATVRCKKDFWSEPDYIEIPPDHVWVQGDNSRVSIDSRDYGPLHRDRIIGRVFATFTVSLPHRVSKTLEYAPRVQVAPKELERIKEAQLIYDSIQENSKNEQDSSNSKSETVSSAQKTDSLIAELKKAVHIEESRSSLAQTDRVSSDDSRKSEDSGEKSDGKS